MEENKNFENEKKQKNRKNKKIIIAVIAAAVVIAVVAAVIAVYSRNKTDENSLSVSQSTTLKTGAENGIVLQSQDNTGQNSNSEGSSSAANTGGNTSKIENNLTTEKQTAPAKRNIIVDIVMPSGGNINDALEIYINDNLEATITENIKVNGEIYRFETEAYEGDVKIEAKLQNYGTEAKKTVYSGQDYVRINLPLNGYEGNDAVDF
ncbi:MAG: hypothetical protein LIO43_03580 [Clostridiales bacterium]|nr:hypothetical protein [Clostridiales bacterium]